MTRTSSRAQKPADHKPKGPKFLPGDSPARDDVKSMLRVNLAGEFGAKRIYEGQLSVLGKGPKGDILRHMAEQEAHHLETFETMVAQRRVRPTALRPLWHVAGYALGAGTALLGEKAAMACTVAVEEVIDAHYQDQLAALGDDEPELSAKIEEFRLEELEHRDIGLDHGATQAPAYSVLTGLIQRGSRLAIWLSERI
jgi:ubiquinone biosynthesis monooxygenase Coq7